MEEIARGPSLWMWDYLRRSGARGYFLPLSGGADSSSTASMVASMAMIIFESVQKGNQETLKDLRKVVQNPDFMPKSYQDIVS
jgi:NAD+ synthase (glutamine-hydrolysing)